MSTEPTPPPADDKDWTWVLERPCPECGFDAAQVRDDAIGGLVLAHADAWVAVLDGSADAVGTRPAPTVWSPLEYACHVRDVLRVFRHRAELILGEDDPSFADWDQDASAVAGRYWEQQPDEVAAAIRAAAADLDAVLRAAGLDPSAWARPGRRSNGSVFTLGSLMRYLLHDVAHHLHDVGAPRVG